MQQYDILARICREDNYIIALYNRLDEFFPTSLSLPFGLRVRHSRTLPPAPVLLL